MDFSLLTLTNEELNLFLESIPIENYHLLYKNNKSFSKRFKGFRIEKLPKEKMVEITSDFLKKKDLTVIKFFSRCFEESTKKCKNRKDELIKEGYSENYAHAIAILDGYHENFIPIYFKLSQFSDEKKIEIQNAMQQYRLTKKICSTTFEDLISKKINPKEQEVTSTKETLTNQSKSLEKTNKKIENLEKQVKKISDIQAQLEEISKNQITRNELNGAKKEQEENIDKIDKKLNTFEKNYVTRNELEKAKKNISQNVSINLDEFSKYLVNNQTIQKLQKQMDEIEKEIKNRNLSSIMVTPHTNEEFESCDDYLDENIDDVINNLVDDDTLNTFRAYLIEIIYSKKPLICSTKNALLLSEIISSIIAGGNYYVLNVSKDAQDIDLVQQIESIPFTDENKVILIQNKMHISDCGFILNYIKTRPFNEKYIFEVFFDKEVLFMPNESLDTFNFFFGNLKNGKIEEKFSYNFSNNVRKPIKNSKYEDTLDSLEISFINKEIYSIDYDGILSYSILPFISLNKERKIKDLLNYIEDVKIREKCEKVFAYESN